MEQETREKGGKDEGVKEEGHGRETKEAGEWKMGERKKK
jgi:hypothetical protein